MNIPSERYYRRLANANTAASEAIDGRGAELLPRGKGLYRDARSVPQRPPPAGAGLHEHAA